MLKIWKTMEKRGITQYDLYTHHNVNRSQINRLRQNQNVEVNTIDKLCNILKCNVEDIMEIYPDPVDSTKKRTARSVQ